MLAGLRTKWQDIYWIICTRDDMCLWLLTQFQPTTTCMLQKIMTSRNVELIKYLLELITKDGEEVNQFYLMGVLRYNRYEICAIMLKHLELDHIFVLATLIYVIEYSYDESLRAMLENDQYRTFIRTSHIPDWMPASNVAKRYVRMIMRVKNA
jgi:hypothetical protein